MLKKHEEPQVSSCPLEVEIMYSRIYCGIYAFILVVVKLLNCEAKEDSADKLISRFTGTVDERCHDRLF
jgi:hypothetical protein